MNAILRSGDGVALVERRPVLLTAALDADLGRRS
jgi:hypothetical protein